MSGTILFGVDVETADENAVGFARWGAELFHELDVPVTWYVTGQTMERYPDVFAPFESDPLIELQSHTYSHMLLKTVCVGVPKGVDYAGAMDGFFVKQGGTNAEIDADLGRAQAVFRDVLGRPATALTGPWCYYRGLRDRPDLLEVVANHGFKLLRTFGRDERDAQPVPLEWEPFFYAPQGHPKILEILIHDYQDDFMWRRYALPDPDARYEDHLLEVAKDVAAHDRVWSAASHDHGCATREGFEEKGRWLRTFIRAAREMGIRFVQASTFYAEQIG